MTPALGQLGFVGIGAMGGQMAIRLARAGFHLVVHDRSSAAMEQLQSTCPGNVTAASSPREVAEATGVHAIFTMLPSTEHVREVFEGPDGLLRAVGGLRPALLVDCSTISPLYTPQLQAAVASAALHPDSQPLQAELGEQAGVPRGAPQFLDAPVSGGVPGATNGTLTFMVGGEPSTLAAAKPLLALMGRNIFHCGTAGAGHAAKVCNNLATAVSMCAVSEALALASSLGLDPCVMTQCLNASSGRCWSSEVYNPCPGVMEGLPSSHGYKGGFRTDLMIKDLGLALEAAQSTGSPSHMTSVAQGLYKQVLDKADQPVDFSSVFHYVYRPSPRERDNPAGGQ